MAIYKCKMCGGELSVNEGNTVIECEFCGTTQTVPTAKDENLQGLFNRANVLRMKSEFDKAEQIYEKIIQADNTQAEAYWGLILCKFGIEYVEDPDTFKRVPTCHRTSLDSIIADDDYKSALNYADGIQRGIYETEAKEIDRLQREIIALSQKEDPYDVFICYKETDETGRRTQDSVIANDIYYQLTQEGFKVFYAAITLEDKLGSAYEPCIFAALNSAKVMLSIGTKPEYFNAVWVKNEWSRFLKIMKKDRSKVLIPCYKDMDAYELPEEFAHLQAQDMSKIGFINDVVRGIKKVLSANAAKDTKKETVVVNANSATTAPLLQRVFMFLEDGNWNSADEYCEKVLDLEPQNALAYVGKLMSQLKVHKQGELINCAEPFDNNGYYQKAIRFADDVLRNTLTCYVSSIKERNKTNMLNDTYNRAMTEKNSADTEESYKRAAAIFETILDWKDAEEQVKDCLEKAEVSRKDKLYNFCKRVFKGEVADTEENWLAAKNGFESIPAWRDADELALQCADKAVVARKNTKYRNAVEESKKNTASSLKAAIKMLQELEGWRDSVQLIMQYEEQIRNLEIAAEEERKKQERLAAERKAKEEAEAKAAAERKSEDERIAAEKAKKRKKTITLCSIAGVVVIVATIILTTVVIPSSHYSKATDFEASGNYESAIIYYQKAGSYKDSQDKLREVSVLNAKNYEVNDTVYLGKYNGKVLEWTVVSVDSNHAVLVCNSIVANKKYNGTRGGIDPSEESYHYNEWPKCSLRTWLNTDFLNAAFNDNEMTALTQATVVSAGEYKNEGTVTDYVYIMSGSEMKNAGATTWDADRSIRGQALWLRGSSGTNGAYAEGHNTGDAYGLELITMRFGVVPVIWLNIQ